MPSQVVEGSFLEPRLEAHVAGCCLGFYFPEDSLSISLLVSILLFVRELSDTREFLSKG